MLCKLGHWPNEVISGIAAANIAAKRGLQSDEQQEEKKYFFHCVFKLVNTER